MENYLRPWIIALLFASLGSSVAWVRGAITSIPILRRFHPEARNEAQIALEKRAELASRFISLGALASVVAFFTLILGADHASKDIEGAMCAHGVIHSNPYGPLALGAAAGVALIGLVFLELHRLDLRSPIPALVRPQFFAFLFAAPLAIYSSHLTLQFVQELDFSIVATCCSSGLTSNLSRGDSLPSTTPALPFFGSLFALLLASSLAFLARRSTAHSRLFALLSATAALLAMATNASALTSTIAPHLYETPTHRCAFCLLSPPEIAFGAPYLVAFFILLIGWIRTTLGAAFYNHQSIGESARDFMKSGARLLILGAVALMLISSFPVIRYRVIADGTLFGW